MLRFYIPERLNIFRLFPVTSLVLLHILRLAPSEFHCT
jgi:hypothetical protein